LSSKLVPAAPTHFFAKKIVYWSSQLANVYRNRIWGGCCATREWLFSWSNLRCTIFVISEGHLLDLSLAWWPFRRSKLANPWEVPAEMHSMSSCVLWSCIHCRKRCRDLDKQLDCCLTVRAKMSGSTCSGHFPAPNKYCLYIQESEVTNCYPDT
jgi:hypothetical protein